MTAGPDSTTDQKSDRKSVLWTCCLTHAVQDGLNTAIYVLLPILAQTFGLSYGTVGLLKGLKSLAQGLLEISSGFAAEMFSERKLLVFGLILAGVGYLLLAFAGGPNTVLACLLIVGFGVAFQHAPSSALVSRAYASAGRRGALGLYNSSGDAGKLIFTACFSLAIGAGLAWQPIVLFFGMTAIATSAVVYVALKPARADKPDAAIRDEKTGSPSLATRWGPATRWGIVDTSGFFALLAVVSLDSMVQSATLTFIAFVMLAKGVSLYIATLAAVCILFGGMCGKAACGFLAERIGVRLAFAILQVLTAAGILAVIAAPSLAAYLLLPFLGVVLQGSTSITYGLVDDFVHPSRTPRGYALIYASGSFASVLGPVGMGLIGDAYGMDAAMFTMAIFTLVAIVPSLLLRVNRLEQAPV
ncbi:MAG: MFS transporter [Alphaproteobacteria bacterium]